MAAMLGASAEDQSLRYVSRSAECREFHHAGRSERAPAGVCQLEVNTGSMLSLYSGSDQSLSGPPKRWRSCWFSVYEPRRVASDELTFLLLSPHSSHASELQSLLVELSEQRKTVLSALSVVQGAQNGRTSDSDLQAFVSLSSFLNAYHTRC